MRTRAGMIGLALVAAMALSGGAPPLAPVVEAATGCTAGTESDFNGDGVRDIAIADPEATVSGHPEAGTVHIAYGGGRGAEEISQDTEGIPGTAEPGDRYGHALATFDHNGDGCADLVVGSPYEDIGDQADAGSVQILYGSPAGLGKGPAALDLHQGKGSGSIASSAAEAGDWFGYSLAAGHTGPGRPYLVIGVPGEDLSGGLRDAGSVHYLRDSINVAFNQNDNGASGLPENDDRFGYSIAASPYHIAVGVPGEAIGDRTFSGGMQLLRHAINSDGNPTPVGGTHQDTPGINGTAETGDQYGAALAAVQYRPPGSSSTTDTLVVVGIPGEDTSTGEDAGRVITLRLTLSGDVTQVADIHQGITGVTGVGEDGDYFGQHLTAVNTAPGSTSTAQNLLLAVGIPGEDIEAAGGKDSGGVQIFPLVGPPGDGDVWLEQGLHGLPGQPGVREYLGTSLSATPQTLHVGKPYGPEADRGVHGIPWANLISGGTGAVSAWRPGEGGIPTGGRAFGAVVR
ncbi:VCBS repeat-containing protein [Streptomyces sp. S1A]|uniref:FG-GAP repeat domain-containing protein n=1 Tax=Streptomyces sp. ICN903 TaxID=2964654 RepID=UPI001EDB25C7|nr:VCBS repeat-containing protein [Streptomyces sp. ICN903]MCG3039415.1 VCBS repeat-containing protein [Streptomyces sp. ICN903]